MLFRDQPSGALAISQLTHAWISGQILRAWDGTLSETLQLAAEQHDIGWIDWEAEPTFNPQPAGRICFAKSARRPMRRCGLAASQRALRRMGNTRRPPHLAPWRGHLPSLHRSPSRGRGRRGCGAELFEYPVANRNGVVASARIGSCRTGERDGPSRFLGHAIFGALRRTEDASGTRGARRDGSS